MSIIRRGLDLSDPSNKFPVVGNSWGPSDSGYISWSHDIATNFQGSQPVQGMVAKVRMPIRRAVTITNLHLSITVVGTSLTAGNNFAGLYQNNVLLRSTADQTSAWGTVGLKTMALTAPKRVSPGYIEVAFYVNGSVTPTFGSAIETFGGSSHSNFGTRKRFFVDNQNLNRTTSLPATSDPAYEIATLGFWAAVS